MLSLKNRNATQQKVETVNDKILYAIYDDEINDAQKAKSAEEILKNNPDDLLTRAHLVHYYHNTRIKSPSNDVDSDRFRHLKWFITNKPYLQFCGGAPFSLKPSDPMYEEVKALWEKATDNFDDEMCKINAYLFIAGSSFIADSSAKADHDIAPRLFDRLFPEETDSLWVLALGDQLKSSENYLSALISVEQNSAMTGDKDLKAKLEKELKKVKSWDLYAFRNCIDGNDAPHETFAKCFAEEMTLDDAAAIAGNTVFRYETSSALRFDPVVLYYRFRLYCWIVKHLPYAKLTSTEAFAGPFCRIKSYTILGNVPTRYFSSMFAFLSELWIAQLHEFELNTNVIQNAATFAFESGRFFVSAIKPLEIELNKTAAGKKALSRVKAR